MGIRWRMNKISGLFRNRPETWRRLYWAICVGLLLCCGYGSWAGQGSGPDAHLYKMIAYAGVFLSGMGVWFFFPSRRSTLCNMRSVFTVALLARLSFWGMDVSDDVNRYLWEGKLTALGESPYATVAADEATLPYRDGFWEKMNHRDRLTAYPPLALFAFAGITSFGYEASAMKAAFVFFDMLVVVVLLAILYEKKLPLRNALFYALNPIVLFAFAGEAHYDSLFIFFLVLGYYGWLKRKEGLAWVAFGLAIQVKILAIVLVPWLFFRAVRKTGVLYLGVAVVAPCLFFGEDIGNLLTGVYAFGAQTAFNSLWHGWLQLLMGSTELASWLLIGLFVISVLGITRYCTRAELAFYLIWSCFLLCSSIVHYWYVAWVIPLVVLLPSLAYGWLSVAMGLYFFTNYYADSTGTWVLPLWATYVIWLPFVVLFLFEQRFLRKRLLYFPQASAPTSYSVVIPVYRDARPLRDCLFSWREQEVPPARIVVVDGDGDKEVAAVARHFSAEYLQARSGRGNQIGVGIDYLGNEEVLVISHADTLLPRAAGRQLLAFLEKHPQASGGVLGQRFRDGGAWLPVIEGLNDLRVMFGGTGFGDQVQFFRRSALVAAGGFEKLPLMEDVALSDKLLSVGYLGLLDNQAASSPRSWRKHGFRKRFVQVMHCMIRYRWASLFQKDVSAELYAYYYGD